CRSGVFFGVACSKANAEDCKGITALCCGLKMDEPEWIENSNSENNGSRVQRIYWECGVKGNIFESAPKTKNKYGARKNF
ncbi:hypothetical protein MKW98_005876, partial [Papaver atlanticum]